MMRASFVTRSGGGRAGISGAPLVRLLARLAEVDVAEPRYAFADRLSQWLGWTDAIALSSALNGPTTAASPERRRGADGAFARQRDALVRAMSADEPRETRPAERGRGVRRAAARIEPADAGADFPSHRRRYLARQQAMEAGVGALREGLRAALAARSPALAKLAAVDAVMERVLGERERSLLSLVPVVLAQRFERLRQDELAARSAAPEAADAPAGEPGQPDTAAPATLSGTWLTTFRKDMHGLLLAELDLRLQPVDGLIEALDAPA